MGLGRVKTKSDLVVMPSGRQCFFAFRVTVEPKIPGAVIPRRVFTQPGSSTDLKGPLSPSPLFLRSRTFDGAQSRASSVPNPDSCLAATSVTGAITSSVHTSAFRAIPKGGRFGPADPFSLPSSALQQGRSLAISARRFRRRRSAGQSIYDLAIIPSLDADIRFV